MEIVNAVLFWLTHPHPRWVYETRDCFNRWAEANRAQIEKFGNYIVNYRK